MIDIEIAGKTKAYSFPELAKRKPIVRECVGRKPINIFYDAASKTAIIKDTEGKELSSVVGFWFAWYWFHPDKKVFKRKPS